MEKALVKYTYQLPAQRPMSQMYMNLQINVSELVMTLFELLNILLCIS